MVFSWLLRDSATDLSFLQTTRGVNPGFNGDETTASISVVTIYPVKEKVEEEEKPEAGITR